MVKIPVNLKKLFISIKQKIFLSLIVSEFTKEVKTSSSMHMVLNEKMIKTDI